MVSAFARTCSDTTGPLSAVPLSRVGEELHRAGSIAWETDAAMVDAFVGAAAGRGHEGPRRSSLRMGTRLDSVERPFGRRGAVGASRGLGVVGDDRHRRVLRRPADDRLFL